MKVSCLGVGLHPEISPEELPFYPYPLPDAQGNWALAGHATGWVAARSGHGASGLGGRHGVLGLGGQ